jgi:hypothetical protein
MGVLGLFRRKKNDPVTLAGGPGDSVENAVIIHCSDYFAGNRAEYQYLEKKCGTFITDWTLDVKMLIKKMGETMTLLASKWKTVEKELFILIQQKC